MAARTREEEQRRRRRKRLVRGLVLGGAAIGVPALLNSLVSRRAQRLPATTWGSGDRYSWRGPGDRIGGDIVFQSLGEGDPLLLVHSLGPGHSGQEWRRAAELLAQSHRVVVPDLLGWGQSDKPAITYDAGLYVELLRDFLVDVVGERAVVVAAGQAAAYAIQVAVDQPELVRALGLVVPLGLELHGDEPEPRDVFVHRLLSLPILGTSALNLYTSRSSLLGYLRREIFGSPSFVDEALVEEHYRLAHLPGAQAPLIAHLAGRLRHGVQAVLDRLEVPVWMAWGRRAASPSVESADLWLLHLPDAELDVLEQCGILPHAESPEEFCRKLVQFLTRASP